MWRLQEEKDLKILLCKSLSHNQQSLPYTRGGLRWILVKISPLFSIGTDCPGQWRDLKDVETGDMG